MRVSYCSSCYSFNTRDSYPRASWYATSFFINSSRSGLGSILWPRFGAIFYHALARAREFESSCHMKRTRSYTGRLTICMRIIRYKERKGSSNREGVLELEVDMQGRCQMVVASDSMVPASSRGGIYLIQQSAQLQHQHSHTTHVLFMLVDIQLCLAREESLTSQR